MRLGARMDEFVRVLLDAIFRKMQGGLANDNHRVAKEALAELNDLLSDLDQKGQTDALALLFAKNLETQDRILFDLTTEFLAEHNLYDLGK